MATFSEASPDEPSDFDLVLIHRNNLYRSAIEQQIKFALTRLALSALDHHRRFEQIRRR
jgi:hypothetical protein